MSLYLLLGALVYGGGNSEETEKKPRNPDWVLTITALDISALPPAQQVLGNIMTRSLIGRLHTIAHRVRVSPEYRYYEAYAWSKDRAAAAKALGAKREKRDSLLFQGEPEWKYRKNLIALDEEILKLEKDLESIEKEAPLIAVQPVFKISEANLGGTFPVPPKAGGEYRFCVNQKADAFLMGSIREFHGRLYVHLKLYTLYNQSFSYEDSTMFSIEDIQQGADELADRLVAAVSGTPSASILIHGNPEETMLLIDGSFAGRGAVGPREHPPGSVEIEGFADNYQPLSIPLELQSDELAELYINLQPLSRETLSIRVPEESGAQVYQGVQYLGQTPLQVDVPVGQFNYFHVETPEGKTGAIIIVGENLGSAEPQRELNLQTSFPPVTGEETGVAKARRRFYGAWGRFWISLPVAFVLQGISDARTRTYNTTGDPELYKSAKRDYYISMGAWIVFGIVLAEVLVRTGIYIYSSWDNADPLVGSAGLPETK